MRSFSGLAGYYRHFIKEFAKISALLHAETSGKGNSQWTEEMNHEFVKCKQALVTEYVLAFPDFEKPFFVKADAYERDVGAVLT